MGGTVEVREESVLSVNAFSSLNGSSGDSVGGGTESPGVPVGVRRRARRSPDGPPWPALSCRYKSTGPRARTGSGDTPESSRGERAGPIKTRKNRKHSGAPLTQYLCVPPPPSYLRWVYRVSVRVCPPLLAECRLSMSESDSGVVGLRGWGSFRDRPDLGSNS